MGVPSISIMLIELIKMLHYAETSNYRIARLGTSGGIGVEPGTIIVTNAALNGLFENKYIQYINGKEVNLI